MDEKERRERDPIAEFLRETLPTTHEQDPRKIEPAWQASVPKIAAWCLAGALALTAAILFMPGAMTGGKEQGGRAVEVVQRVTAPSERRVVGSVVMVDSGVMLHGEEGGREARIGDEVGEGDVIETGEDATVGLEMDSGPRLVLMAWSRMAVVRGSSDEVEVTLERGVIAADTSRPGALRGLRVEGSNAEIIGRGSVFTVEASEGLLESMSVADGEVAVLNRLNRKDVRIGRSSRLDMLTWTASAGSMHVDALERLAGLEGASAVTEAVESPGGSAMTEEPNGPGSGSPSSLLQAVRDALDEGNVDLAIQLLEAGGKGRDDPEVLLLAGDAYKQAGRWSEAVDSYLAAASGSEGKKAERALLRAAEIRSRKLDDANGAAGIIDGYLERFPAGIYLDEALYLGGNVQAMLGNFEKARGLFERYLELFPKGTQALRVHLTLAKVLATRLSDCPAAMVHVEAIRGMVAGPAVSEEAEKVAMHCAGSKEGEK